jgi:hypothetical protein
MMAGVSRRRRARSLHTDLVRLTVASALAVSMAAVAPVAARASAGARPSVTPQSVHRVGNAANRGAGSAFVVTLVTGDRVAVTRLGSGRIGARFLPGSPSIGAGQQVTAGMGYAYVLPRTLTRADTLNLDTSLFDVLALHRMTRTDGSVPVIVTFKGGSSAHQLRGLRVDLRSAHRNASGRVVAGASYTKASTRAVNAQHRAWTGVASVRLAGTRPMTAPSGSSSKYVLHTLTLKLVDRSGAGVPFGDMVVQNVDDTRLYFADAFFGKAGIKLSVLDGNYSVIAADFSHRAFRVAVNGQFRVSDDLKLVLSTAHSTSKVGVSVPGAKPKEVDFVYLRKDAKRGSFSYFFGSVPRAPVLVNPVKPSNVTVGTLTSEVRSHLGGGDKTTFDTIQGFNGIPVDLDRSYPLSAFARQRNTYYSDERGRHSFRADFRFLPGDFFDFEALIPFTRPSVRDSRWEL